MTPPMIGVDFDNTIVCYDNVFHQVAVDEGLCPAGVGTSKEAVRNYLRAQGREDDWTALQGLVYGARIAAAPAFAGVLTFFRTALAAGVPICIVSHKTRYPFLGHPHDLHAAARGWLQTQGFFNRDGIGLDPARVFFEPTKAGKLARIGTLGCDVFIDDLPEFLAEPDFPSNVRRILFDPNRHHPDGAGFHRADSWEQLTRDLFEPCREERRKGLERA